MLGDHLADAADRDVVTLLVDHAEARQQDSRPLLRHQRSWSSCRSA
jgi:hypothetical protein